MIVQIIRRLTQAMALVVVVALPLLSLYAHYRAARVIEDEQLMAGLCGETITRLVHPYVDALEDPQTFLDNNKGTLWSMRLAGVELTDPLAAAEMLAASKHFHLPLFISILIPVAVTVILGRVFCSWICPGYLLFELAGTLRRLLAFAEIQPATVKFRLVNKYAFLFAGLAVILLTSEPLFALIYPPAVISRAVHAWIFGTSLVGMLVILSVIVAFEVFVSPRWWCRTICPGGALYALIGWLRPLRVKLDRDACTSCEDCIPVCEAGINPITHSASIECDNCGVCIRHCGEDALGYAIGLPTLGLRSTEGKRRGQARGAGAKPAAIVAGLLVSLAVTSPIAAHHILGLPHYSYKENYPQRPTLEYPATTGPYDVLLTAYPGEPVPGEPTNLAVYIKNRETQRVYSEPVTLGVLQTSTFGDNTVIMQPTTRGPFDNEYKFHVTFPEDGEYIIELSIQVEGRVEVIPFLMIAGQPTAMASFVVSGAFGAVVIFVVVRAVQRKRRRHRASIAESERLNQGKASGDPCTLREAAR